MNRLTLALTKGRLEKETIRLLSKMDCDVAPLTEKSRRLVHSIPNYPLDIVQAKAADVITYVEHGVCDMGVVGKDTIMEEGHSLYEVLDLGFGRCRFALAVRKGEELYTHLRDIRIATKYPKVAKDFFDRKGLNVEIIKIEGSVELAPLLGLADGIVDLVETGSTLLENGLIPIEDICVISARLVVNTVAMKLRRTEIRQFMNELQTAAEM